LTTSFDAQWDPAEQWEMDIENILPYVDLFFPNEQELLHLTKQSSITEAISSLGKNANAVIVKMGNKGSISWYKGEIVKIAAFKNENVVDAIGAGDSFNAGFIYQFLQGASVEDCQYFGNLCGAVNTTAPGGTTAFTNYDEILKAADPLISPDK
ncbi:carbohydrate kinase family protein, partial [bacterium]|nr:carbohydrate kinase family protein [bacterium]